MKINIRFIKWLAVLSSVIIFAFTMQRCYYDSKEYLFPEVSNTCDTTNVTYLASVTLVLDQFCTGCHSGTSASGGIKLDNYTDVKAQANNGKLMGSIKHSSGYIAMPQGSSKLSDCNIAILQKWVDAGAPNN